MAKKFTRDDGYTENDLLHSAMDHLASVGTLLGIGFRGLDSAGYLAHLGIEIFLKAFLLHRDDGFPETHKLQNLVNQCSSDGFQFVLDEDLVDLLAKLDKFYDLRYPNPKDPVSVSTDELQRLPDLATRILSHFPDSLIDELEKIGKPQPDGLYLKGGRIFMLKPNEATEGINEGK